MTFADRPSTTLDDEDGLTAEGRALGVTFERWARGAAAVILGGVRHVEPNMVPVAMCAAIMFPAYWFVWKFLFPQPYENLWIRLLGSLLCLVIAAKDWWPRRSRRFLPVLWLATVLYSGPFFFTFMLLQNNTSTVWLLSTMAGLFLVILLLDWISLFALFLLGSVLAWRVHLWLSPDIAAVGLYFEYVPIFLFALTAGTIFNYRAAGLRQAKERARLELGMLLAKEMRSPLVTMRTSAASLSRLLPPLIRAYPGSRPADAAAPSSRQLQALERVPARIEEAAEEMGDIIDLLMFEAGEAALDHRRASSMQRCLDDAIARLPVAAELDRARIRIDRTYDFLFYGSPVLMRHLLARVLDASLNEVCAETGAELLVALGTVGDRNCLRLVDAAALLHGTVGARRAGRHRDPDFGRRADLALADFVLGRMGGFVTRSRVHGRITETILWFPLPGA